MAKISWARVDYRLIHGQVITKWSKIASANQIVIVDDVLGQDEFMASIYKMAAPSGVGVDIKTAADAAAAYKDGTLGTGNIFLLFKGMFTRRAPRTRPGSRSRPSSLAASPPRRAARSCSPRLRSARQR